MTPDDSWREHVDRELAHMDEKFGLKLDALVSVWRAQNRTLRRALKLQAKEYERRLQGLNHEAERLKEAALLSVPREKYDADRKGDEVATEVAAAALRTAKGEMDAQLSVLRDQVRTDTDTRTGQAKGEAIAAAERAKLIGYIGIAIAVVSMVLKFLPLNGGTP